MSCFEDTVNYVPDRTVTPINIYFDDITLFESVALFSGFRIFMAIITVITHVLLITCAIGTSIIFILGVICHTDRHATAWRYNYF